jgi:hypothetical protein
VGLCERWHRLYRGSGSEQGEPNFCVDVEGCIKERQAESLGLGLEHIQPFSFIIPLIMSVCMSVFAQKCVLRIPPMRSVSEKEQA